MSVRFTPLGAEIANLCYPSAPAPARSRLPAALHALIAAIFARIFARLDAIFQLWQAGHFPAPVPHRRSHAILPSQAITRAPRPVTPRQRRKSPRRQHCVIITPIKTPRAPYPPAQIPASRASWRPRLRARPARAPPIRAIFDPLGASTGSCR